MNAKTQKTPSCTNSSVEIVQARLVEKRAIGARLAEARKALGMTQKALAGVIGAKVPTLKGWEGGKSIPSGEFSSRMAKIGINTYRVTSGEGPVLLTVSRIGHARDAVVRFVTKRSSVSEGDARDLIQAAFDRDLDEEGLEREYGERHPIGGSPRVDIARLALAVDTVEKEIERGGKKMETTARAQLIATVYDIFEDTTDRTIDQVATLLRLAL